MYYHSTVIVLLVVGFPYFGSSGAGGTSALRFSRAHLFSTVGREVFLFEVPVSSFLT